MELINNYKLLARADLNLLVSFQILMEEKSVSGAAERAFVSQSAMSRTLQRLRELFDNPLFVRQSHGLLPTQRAIDLYEALQPLLMGIDSLLKPVTFDPKTLEGQFVIACPSLLSSTWLSGLVARLAKIAPKVKLRSIETVATPEQLLTNGSADIAIHTADKKGSEFFTMALPDATTLSLVRDGHPIKEQEMTLEQFLSYPHLRYYIPGLNIDNQGLIDLRLAKLGKQREIRYDGHDMATLLQITRHSDCIFSLASVKGDIQSENKKDWSGIRILQCPTQLEMTNLPIALIGLSRRESDPALQWLAKEIRDCFNY
ncbi:LysR family transcriptional regulator [Colwellia psychrerythraea]|uniref:Transcriptional regulator, LysR family n=1 Tax=Colwellia psychrerythraea TaxID=28229 RepID=A0A099KVC9_COLPS|nr:LysR family transcriptional regulator [Colwellia psychrerythraea]KGJ94120.1 transcriptional regulator, LysR family [Colwellia psychrerythraea]